MAKEKDVVVSTGIDWNEDEIESQLKDIEALIVKYLGPKAITPKIREGLIKGIKTIPDYTKNFLNRRSESGVKKMLSQVVDIQEKEIKNILNASTLQKEYNEEVSKLLDMLKNRKYDTLSDFYKIGTQLRQANFAGKMNGVDTKAGTSAYNDVYLAQEDEFLDLAKRLKGIISKKEIAEMQLPLISRQMRALREEIILTSAKGENIKNLTNELNRLAGIEKKLQKATGLSTWSKLLKRFTSYATIRLFRNFFSSVEQGMGNSINSLASFSSEFKGTMSSITSSFDMMSSSLVLILQPILEVIEPVLKELAVTFAEVANTISYFSAKLKGNGTYLKINTDYLKEFNKQAEESNKLSFDNFEALSSSMQEIDPHKMFDEVSVDSGLTEGMREALTILEAIGGVLLLIGTYKFMDWIISGNASKFFKTLTEDLGKVKTKVTDIGNAGLIASSAFAFATSIINLIDVIANWNSQSLVTQITAIIGALAGVASVLFTIFALTGVGSTKVMKALAIGLGAGSTLMVGISAFRFADGGIPQQGSLFVAGEAGAEFVTKMPSGQTGVTNIAQFKQAMVEALYECSDIFQNGNGGGEVVLNLDGAEIARSKRFVSEVNRKNSGLSLR